MWNSLPSIFSLSFKSLIRCQIEVFPDQKAPMPSLLSPRILLYSASRYSSLYYILQLRWLLLQIQVQYINLEHRTNVGARDVIFLRYERHLKAVGLNEIIYRVSINHSRTKVQENNVNLNFYYHFSFMENIICPLCIRDKCLLNTVTYKWIGYFSLKLLLLFKFHPFFVICHIIKWESYKVWKDKI